MFVFFFVWEVGGPVVQGQDLRMFSAESEFGFVQGLRVSGSGLLQGFRISGGWAGIARHIESSLRNRPREMGCLVLNRPNVL